MQHIFGSSWVLLLTCGQFAIAKFFIVCLFSSSSSDNGADSIPRNIAPRVNKQTCIEKCCIFCCISTRMMIQCVVIQFWHLITPLIQTQSASLLWHCWLGVGKIIWPVKNEWWGVVVVICLGARCRLLTYGPADATASRDSHHLLPQLNPEWFLPFWYRLTQVVSLIECSSSTSLIPTHPGLPCLTRCNDYWW